MRHVIRSGSMRIVWMLPLALAVGCKSEVRGVAPPDDGSVCGTGECVDHFDSGTVAPDMSVVTAPAPYVL